MTNTTQTAVYRPSLSFYHPNGKGTGCAIKMELHPAHDRTDGCIMMSVANQLTIGDRTGSTPTFAKFDWDSKITVKLDFSDLSKMLQVLRGECESIEDGRGLYHRTERFSTKIMLRHLIEPCHGYSLEVYRTTEKGDDSHSHFVFTASEAVGLTASIESSFGVICFGIPMVIRRAMQGGSSSDEAA